MANSIVIQVNLQAGTATQTLGKVNVGIAQLGLTSNKTSQQATRAFNSMTQSSMGLANALGQLRNAFAGLGLIGAAKSLLTLFSTFEKARISMSAVSTDTNAAAEGFERLKVTARATGISFESMKDSWLRLKGAGFTEQEATKLSTSIAQWALTVGRGEEAIYSFGKAMGDIMAKQKVNAQEIQRQFGELNVPVTEWLRRELSLQEKRNINEREFFEIMESGRLNANATLAVIQRNLQGLIKAQEVFKIVTQVPTQSWDAFIEKVKQAGAEMGSNLVPASRQLLTALNMLVNGVANFTGWLGRMNPELRASVFQFLAFAAAIRGVAAAIRLVLPLLMSWQKLVATLVGFAIIKLPDWVGEAPRLRKFLDEYLPLLSKLIDKIGEARKAIKDYFFDPTPSAGMEQLLANVRQLEKEFSDLTQTRIGSARPAPLEKMDADWLKFYQGNLQDMIAQVKKDLKEIPTLLGKSELEIRHALEAGEAILSAARARNEQFIGSPYAKLTYQYEERFKATQASAEGTAMAITAYFLELHHEGSKQLKAIEDDMLDFQMKTLEFATDMQAIRLQLAPVDAPRDQVSVVKQIGQLQADAIDKRHQLEKKAIERRRNLDLEALAEVRTRMPWAKEELRSLTAQIDVAHYKDSLLLFEQAEQDKQRIALETARETNRIIIEDQKRVFEEFRAVAADIFDALFDRSQSVWKAMGNVLKKTMINTMRDAFSGQAAAAATGIAGVGKVDFKGGIMDKLLGRYPTFAPQNQSITMQRPEIIDTKLDFTNSTIINEAHRSMDEDSGAPGDLTGLNASQLAILNAAKARMQSESPAEALFDAIKRNEGFYPGSAAYRNNNPGNLMGPNGLRTFSTLSEGEAALRKQIDTNIGRDLTLREFFGGKPGVYAGYDKTDPLYAAKVSQWTGLPLDAKLKGGAAVVPRGISRVPFWGAVADYFRKRFPSGSTAASAASAADLYTLPRTMGTQAIASAGSTWGQGMAMMQVNQGAATNFADVYNLPRSDAQMNMSAMLAQGLPSANPLGAPGISGTQSNWATRFKDNFDIGKPIQTASGITEWAKATPRQKLGAITASDGFRSLASSVGVGVALQGLQSSGVLGTTKTIGGAALAGFGMAGMLGFTGLGGGLLGASVGLAAAGLKRGGVSGLAMSTLGGAGAGALLGLRFGGAPGAVIGAAVGAAVGAGLGIARLFYKTADEKMRAIIKKVYGIDIPDAGIRKQMVDLAKERYGGNLELAARSPEVQELVRLYSMSTGQQANLPREMYSATFAQSGAGGLQLQPVYSNGLPVQSPYSGATPQQWATGGTYIQLNPTQANNLFEGKVVKVIGDNPEAVSNANASAVRAGDSRNAQRQALLEPATVTR